MTPIEANIAIAETQGWVGLRTFWHQNNTYLLGYSKSNPFPHPMGEEIVPDYWNDLNAMHEVEATIDEGADWCGYFFDLKNVVGHEAGHINRKMVMAAAAQRAEAYLRMTGKWKE